MWIQVALGELDGVAKAIGHITDEVTHLSENGDHVKDRCG